MPETNSKIAIVTGGGSGIGLAIAENFVRNGIHTIIVGRDAAKLSAAAKALAPRCEPRSFDMNDLPRIPSFVESIINEHGRIDILVNNAGINMKKDFVSVTEEEFQTILQTNVVSVFALSREVVKCMLEKATAGSIINISSMASQYGIPKVIA